MARVVRQSVLLPASARDLYSTYLSPKRHGAITGGRVVVNSRPGSSFRAFSGALRGRMLQTIPGRLIVQSWRSSAFRKSDPDSTLIIRFTQQGKHGRVDLVHVNVPDHDYAGVNKGWKSYYWRPWRKILARR